MSDTERIEPVDFEEMSADDWRKYLTEHPDRALQATDSEGTHEFRYDADSGYVRFWAFGSQGYDCDGSRSALEEVAGESAGLALVGYEDEVEAVDSGACEMPECSRHGDLVACRDPSGDLLDLCRQCRSEWPVEVLES